MGLRLVGAFRFHLSSNGLWSMGRALCVRLEQIGKDLGPYTRSTFGLDLKVTMNEGGSFVRYTPYLSICKLSEAAAC